MGQLSCRSGDLFIHKASNILPRRSRHDGLLNYEMTPQIGPIILNELQRAFQQRNLTLYLGAGVSVGNGLPNWSQLVLAMYFSAVRGDWKVRWKPYPNYLYAIAEWQLSRGHEPLEITARKVQQYYGSDDEGFLKDLRETLYAGFNPQLGAGEPVLPSKSQLRLANSTLDGVADLCASSTSKRGIHAVVTYNYDNLLERATEGDSCRFVPVWGAGQKVAANERPIVHVHGYIPDTGSGSKLGDIVFTEQQYHAAAHSPYSWSNLSQIQCLSSSVGLMVGLSLSDRNMRRLLDAVRVTPLHKPQFAIIKKPSWEKPDNAQLDAIDQKAQGYISRFRKSGAKTKGEKAASEMIEIFEELNRHEESNYTQMLNDMGITPIWYTNHKDVRGILSQIVE